MKRLAQSFLLLLVLGLAPVLADVVAKVCTKVPNPSDSPGAGTYSSPQTVTLADSTYTGAGLYICYTTNGSAPWFNGSTCGNGTHYTGAITVSSTETVKYVACGTNYSCSPVQSSFYTITILPVRVQVASATIASGSTCVLGSGSTVPWASSGASHLIVVEAYNHSTNSMTIDDNLHSSYTSLFSTACQGDGCQAWYLKSSASGISTITVSGPTSDFGCIGVEYSSTNTTAPLDQLSTENVSTSPWASDLVTTTQAAEVLLGFAVDNSSLTMAASGSWTKIADASPTVSPTRGMILEEQIVSATQTNVGATGTSGCCNTSSWIATFKGQ